MVDLGGFAIASYRVYRVIQPLGRAWRRDVSQLYLEHCANIGESLFLCKEISYRVSPELSPNGIEALNARPVILSAFRKSSPMFRCISLVFRLLSREHYPAGERGAWRREVLQH